MKRKTKQEEREEAMRRAEKRPPMSNLGKRPYGLCARVGIPTRGLTPGEAWEAWDAYVRAEKRRRKEQKRLEKKATRAEKRARKEKRAGKPVQMSLF